MSYILDALKKSEEERRQNAPERGAPAQIMQTPATSSAATPPWLIALVVGLLLAVVVMAGYLMSRSTTEPVPSAPVSVDRPVAEDVAPQAKPGSEPADARPVKQKETVTSTLAEPVSPVPVVETSLAPAPKTGAPPEAQLRTIPTLDITGHLYSSVPERRSVTMNNRVWREGDVVTGGIRIKEITKDGLTLDVSGWTVFVSRSRGWQAIN